MTRLLRAELARAGARPFVWFVTAGVALGVLGLVLTGWWESRPPSAAQVAAADEAYAQEVAVWAENEASIMAGCQEHEGRARPELSADEVVALCASWAPTREAYELPRPEVAALLAERLPSVGVMVALGSLMIGTGAVTAEFASGAIGTWLTFAPRRGRVFVSKLAAAVTAVLPCGLVALGGFVGGLVLVGLVNGLPTGLTSDAWADLAAVSGRWLVAAGGFAALGVGLGFALRHAAAVTGVVVWWVAAIETALPLVLPAVRWLPLSTNVTAFTAGHAEYAVPTCVPDPAVPGSEICEQVVHVVPLGQGALVAVLAVAVALVVGAVTFRLRDV